MLSSQWLCGHCHFNHLSLFCLGCLTHQLHRSNHTNNQIILTRMLFLDSEFLINYLVIGGKARVAQLLYVFNSADHWLFCLSQGSVSFIVMGWWITSTCARMEPVAPAGTKRLHISVGHLWVQVHWWLFFFSLLVFLHSKWIKMYVCAIGRFCENQSTWRTQVFVEWTTTNTVSVSTLIKKCFKYL